MYKKRRTKKKKGSFAEATVVNHKKHPSVIHNI